MLLPDHPTPLLSEPIPGSGALCHIPEKQGENRPGQGYDEFSAMKAALCMETTGAYVRISKEVNQ